MSLPLPLSASGTVLLLVGMHGNVCIRSFRIKKKKGEVGVQRQNPAIAMLVHVTVVFRV
jgi:hypothetical protein